MTNFDNLKSTILQFSIFELLQNKLSDCLIEKILAVDISFKDEAILFRELKTKKDAKELRFFLEKNKNKLQPYLYDDCSEEFKQIKNDIDWCTSKDGKLILEIDRWTELIREKIKTNFKDYKIFVGRSFIEPKELIVGGIVIDEKEIENIKGFIESENPPVHPAYKFAAE